MQNQSNAFNCTLRVLFVSVAFVVTGWLALTHPNDWVLLVVELAISLLVAYALVFALVSTGSRRLSWAAFLGTLATNAWFLLPGYRGQLPTEFVRWASAIRGQPHRFHGKEDANFATILACLLIIAVSTASAYVIPWLVQRVGATRFDGGELGARVSNGEVDVVECLQCGTEIPPGSAKCSACGWSYSEEGEGEK